jgi:hypothetical protein
MADQTFDQYEYVAVVVPGATLLLGLSIEWPQYLHTASDKTLSLGALGLFLVVSFIIGQALQSVGDIFDFVFWFFFRGIPTDWVRAGDNWLISNDQRTELQGRVRTLIGNAQFDIGTVDPEGWRGITRQIYATVSQAGQAARVDAFNRTYGLMRGFAVALIVLAVTFFVVDPALRWLAISAVVLAAFAVVRSFLFGRDYGRELFAEFLALPRISVGACDA